MMDLNLPFPECLKNQFSGKDNFTEKKHIVSREVYNTLDDFYYPSISIVIPTYNAAFVKDAIASALGQIDAPPYEVLVIDNGSDERIFNDMLDYIKSQISSIIRVYRNETNLGMYGNWNRGIELARAEYVTFLHSDDLLMETCLKDLWACHLQIEPEAAIITQERIARMDGTVVSEDTVGRAKLLGILKPKLIAKRNKLQLLSPHGNGCGHLFFKNAMKEIGGYGESGDFGFILNYNLRFPVYDLKKITRIKRVGENESVKVAESFRAFGYHQRNLVIDKFFHGSFLLKYVSKLIAINTSFEMYGVKPLRELTKFETLFLKLYNKYVNLKSSYTFGF